MPHLACPHCGKGHYKTFLAERCAAAHGAERHRQAMAITGAQEGPGRPVRAPIPVLAVPEAPKPAPEPKTAAREAREAATIVRGDPGATREPQATPAGHVLLTAAQAAVLRHYAAVIGKDPEAAFDPGNRTLLRVIQKAVGAPSPSDTVLANWISVDAHRELR